MRNNFVINISKWQDTRKPWLILIIVTIGLTCIAHFLFQEYLLWNLANNVCI